MRHVNDRRVGASLSISLGGIKEEEAGKGEAPPPLPTQLRQRRAECDDASLAAREADAFWMAAEGGRLAAGAPEASSTPVLLQRHSAHKHGVWARVRGRERTRVLRGLECSQLDTCIG
jgi:hypothetical protein